MVEKCIKSDYVTNSFLYEKVISSHIITSMNSLTKYVLYNNPTESGDELAIIFYRILFGPFRIYTK